MKSKITSLAMVILIVVMGLFACASSFSENITLDFGKANGIYMTNSFGTKFPAFWIDQVSGTNYVYLSSGYHVLRINEDNPHSITLWGEEAGTEEQIEIKGSFATAENPLMDSAVIRQEAFYWDGTTHKKAVFHQITKMLSDAPKFRTVISMGEYQSEIPIMAYEYDSGNTYPLLYVDGEWKKVEFGEPDSAGTGYRILRVEN